MSEQWAAFQPVAHCHHPYADRVVDGDLEVCGWCGETRPVGGGLWPAVTKPSREVRPPHSRTQPTDSSQ